MLIKEFSEMDPDPIRNQSCVNLNQMDHVEDCRTKLSQVSLGPAQSFLSNHFIPFKNNRYQQWDSVCYPIRRRLDSHLSVGKPPNEQLNPLRFVENEIYSIFFGAHETEFVPQVHRRASINH